MKAKTFRVDPVGDALEKAQKRLSGIPNGFQKAFVSASNRAVQSGRAAAAREIRRDYTLKASSITKTFKTTKMKAGSLQAELTSVGRRVPLSSMKHSPRDEETTGANRKQIRVEVKKGHKVALQTGFKHKNQIFIRLGQKPYPIKHLSTVSVPEMLDQEERREAVEEAMTSTIEKRLEHETLRLLNKK